MANNLFRINKGISLTPQSSAPSGTANPGDIYFDGITNTLKIYNGTTWESAGSGGSNQALTFDTITNVGLTATSASYDGSTAVTLGIDNTIIATLTDSQTLTNKTIDASSNTLSNIANSSLVNSSITINGTPVSLGGSTTISTSIADLTVGSGLQLDSGTVFDGTVAKTISIDSSVATLTDSQTLTNKTLTSPVVTSLYVDNIIGYPSTLSLNTLSSAGPSGFNTSNISIQTGAQSIGGYNTGNVSITTGNASDILLVSSGTSGDVTISTGNSTDQYAGDVIISTGTGNPGGVAIRGNIELSAENTLLKDGLGSLIGTINNSGVALESALGLTLKNTTTQITLKAKSGGSSYNLNLPSSAPTDGTGLLYNGTDYIWGQSNKIPTITKITTVGAGTYTTPANVKYIKVRMVGGGAGGGGSQTTGRRGGGGGGGGGYLEFFIDSPAATYSYILGTGGSGGAINGNGGIGGTTSFGSNTASGGGAGSSGSSGAGGTGSTGTLSTGVGFAAYGQGGESGEGDDFASVCGGAGGSSLLGGGARGSAAGSAGASANANSGGGGGGAGATTSGGFVGGSGGSGIIIVEEYYKY